MSRQPHSLLQQAVKQTLELCGWFVVPIKAGMGSYRGVADLYCLRAGKSIWLEIKTGKQTISREQKQFIFDIRGKGGYAAVVRSLEDLKQAGMIENIML